ncbi:MAG: alkaline phosphatase family protein [Clostridia bacterium]
MKECGSPQLDNFLHETVKYALRSRSPQVNFVHYVDLDATRHLHGHDSPEAYQALRRHDARLGELMDAFVEEGLEDQVTWVILGDHSSIDEHTAVYLNQFFWGTGMATAQSKGRSPLVEGSLSAL